MVTVSNNATSNYYLKLTNRGAYIAFYYLWYYVNSQFFGFVSPFIPVLQSYTMNIPANAIGINFLANYVTAIELYGTFSELSFDKPDQICLTSYGTVFNAWVVQTPCSGLGSSNPLSQPSQCPCGTVPVCLPSCTPISCYKPVSC